jgi:hypothetical protein
MTKILINLVFEVCSKQTPIDFAVKLDNDTVLHSQCLSQVQEITIDKTVNIGPHQLIIDIFNVPQRKSIDHEDSKIIVHSVKFQYLDFDFKIFSNYTPQYPKHLLKDASQNNINLNNNFHSTYLSWPGHWILDFQTPVYRWAHQQLKLGWLV